VPVVPVELDVDGALELKMQGFVVEVFKVLLVSVCASVSRTTLPLASGNVAVLPFAVDGVAVKNVLSPGKRNPYSGCPPNTPVTVELAPPAEVKT